MACYSPIEAFRLDNGSIVFSERRGVHYPLKLACGQCIGCRLERSRNWAVRCMHEAQMHSASCFITLTYDDAHFSSLNYSLNYAHFQAFIRRVRKKVGKCRFYMCGEYGSLNSRPHFHSCIFGLDFPDKVLFRRLDSGCRIYRSPLLESLWTFGYSSIGDVTFESAAYVARYICKKVTGDLAATHYMRVDPISGEIFNISPEFCHMSLKPGIGRAWFDRYLADVFPHDRVIVRGKSVGVPKYYKQLLKLRDPFLSDDLDFDRVKNAEKFVDDCTEARLLARETVHRARLTFLKRGLE